MTPEECRDAIGVAVLYRGRPGTLIGYSQLALVEFEDGVLQVNPYVLVRQDC